jgi:hypothetical protein
MPLYEHVFLARQDLAQGQVDALAETATNIITENGGRVIKAETWGLRNLPIASRRTARRITCCSTSRLRPRSSQSWSARPRSTKTSSAT